MHGDQSHPTHGTASTRLKRPKLWSGLFVVVLATGILAFAWRMNRHFTERNLTLGDSLSYYLQSAHVMPASKVLGSPAAWREATKSPEALTALHCIVLARTGMK